MKGIGEPLQNNTKNKKGKVSITLDESVIKEIQELADSDNRKFSPYINLILIDWIQNHPRKEKIGAINSTYSLIWMKQKLCKFSDEEYAILETIKISVPEVSTCMGAIRFLIKKYQLETKQSISLNDISTELRKLQKTLSYAERNTEVSVDALNTLLMLNNPDACYLTDVYKHPAIQYAEDNIKDKIAHNKQRKDFRKQKGKGNRT